MNKIIILILLLFGANMFSVDAKPRNKNCPKRVYGTADNYRGHKCPPKRKIINAKYY